METEIDQLKSELEELKHWARVRGLELLSFPVPIEATQACKEIADLWRDEQPGEARLVLTGYAATRDTINREWSLQMVRAANEKATALQSSLTAAQAREKKLKAAIDAALAEKKPPSDQLSRRMETPPEATGEQASTELQRAIGNCYMSARRGLSNVSIREKMLQAIVRFCESVGEKPQLLRWQVPTELTEGSGVAGQAPPLARDELRRESIPESSATPEGKLP